MVEIIWNPNVQKSSFQFLFDYCKLLLSTFIVFNKNKISIEFHASSIYTLIAQTNLSTLLLYRYLEKVVNRDHDVWQRLRKVILPFFVNRFQGK